MLEPLFFIPLRPRIYLPVEEVSCKEGNPNLNNLRTLLKPRGGVMFTMFTLPYFIPRDKIIL